MTLQILPRSKTPSGTTYIDRGTGAETVVLIHGVGMRADAWAPQIDYLSGQYRVIATDLPGHGQSAFLAGPARLPSFVDWLIRLIDELSLDKISLAGHSLGALIAAGAVAEAPTRISRVALLNSVYRRTPEASRAVIARADEIVSNNFDREAPLSRWFTEKEIDSPPYNFVRALLQDVDRDGYAAAYRAFATGDSVYADRWREVECPSLFVTGDGDPNSTPEMSLEMAETAPRGYAVIIAGHRHMVNLTAPDIVNDLMFDWLRTT